MSFLFAMPVFTLELCLKPRTSWMASDNFWGQFANYLRRCPYFSGTHRSVLLSGSLCPLETCHRIVTNSKLTFNFYFSLLFFILENTGKISIPLSLFSYVELEIVLSSSIFRRYSWPSIKLMNSPFVRSVGRRNVIAGKFD